MDIVNNLQGTEIAIIGMAGRFPGARNLDEFWRNLQDGVESIRFLNDQEVEALGVSAAVRNDSNYVKAAAVLDDIDLFDAAFFGYTPRDAELIDPQQRIFLECAWEALESAGYNPETYPGAIGVFAGSVLSTYLLDNLLPNRQSVTNADPVQVTIGNSNGFLATRVSYNLNLRGPSVAVQTACSTSLVAIHLACQSLLNIECEMALAGGICINVGHPGGYHYAEGGIGSPDGHTRAFDANARGSIFGSGVGVVILKRLEDALADGDTIRAVIRGSAINNDGANKVGYTAPSVEGQTAVISEALSVSRVQADTIDYVEAHGTGTPLGDPIEVRALTRAFRADTDAKHFCALGSVKTNVGHLSAAAGVAGLIKSVLALEHKLIPPSLHFAQPNPEIDFENSPFWVNTKLYEWETGDKPRRAGVSSFGLGGTNAHIILEEAPNVQQSIKSQRPYQLLLLSARNSTTLDTATANLANHLQQLPDINVPDVAYTLQVGRQVFSHRRIAICKSQADALSILETRDPQRVFTAVSKYQGRPVAFLFPGMGEQYVNMALGLYQTEPVFRTYIDRCAEILQPILGLDIREVLYPHGTQTDNEVQQQADLSHNPNAGIDLRKLMGRGNTSFSNGAAQKLNQTEIAHSIIFTVEYALAQLWIAWGIQPQAMIGHSIGEYVAACLAGVFTMENGLRLIAQRSKMIGRISSGAMLAIFLSEDEARSLLNESLSLAAINAPTSCVISGTVEAVNELQHQLTKKGIVSQRVQTHHAVHSKMMMPLAESFTELVRQIPLHPPQIPYLSNVTGTWITAAAATDPEYWARHMCQTVHFADGVALLLKRPEQILLEVGPGLTLSSFITQHPDKAAEHVVLTSLRHDDNPQPDAAYLLTTLGRLWLAGVSIDWSGFYKHEPRLRIPLPTYPFERQRYWIDGHVPTQASPNLLVQGKNPNIDHWFFAPTWEQTPQLPPMPELDGVQSWLVFVDALGVGLKLVERLQALNQMVTVVVAGEKLGQSGEGVYTLNPSEKGDYIKLVQQLQMKDQLPDMVAHMWTITTSKLEPSELTYFSHMQDLGYYSLLFLAQALALIVPDQTVHIGVIADKVYEVSGEDEICPEKATLLGPCKVIPQEHQNLSCVCIDAKWAKANPRQEHKLIDYLITELAARTVEVAVAYRAGKRWIQNYIPVPLHTDDTVRHPLRERGVYWIIGGLGNVGSIIGRYLAQALKARLVLSSRSTLPPRERWDIILAEHDSNDNIAQKIRHIQTLEALGAEVIFVQADASNETQMQRAITEIYDRFGELNGVYHIAGVTDGPSIHSPLLEMGKVESEIQFRSKVNSLYVLEKILNGYQLDLCLVFSSSSAVLGGLGFIAYASAHAFMDAFVLRRNQTSSIPWMSVNWDLWPMAMKSEQSVQSSFDQYGMTPEEGQEAFRRVANFAEEGQIVVVTGDLQPRLDRWLRQVGGDRNQPVTLYNRPALAHDYIPPRNETEQAIANIWSKVLGIKQVGIYDNFFELGGHSLLMTQILSDLRQHFQLELPVRSLFERTTVSDLAQFIETGGGQASKGEEKSLVAQIQTAFPTDRAALFQTYLKQKIALALDFSVDQFPQDGNLTVFDPENYTVDLMVHLKQDFDIQVFPQEIHRIPTIETMTQFIMTEFDRTSDLTQVATSIPLSAYTMQPYRKRSAQKRIGNYPKNETAVFLLSSPRAGSTIFRVMLAGHPDLFCPPELYLLHFETLKEWNQDVGFGDDLAWNRQGLELAFGELLNISREESQAYINRLITRNASIHAVSKELQELAGRRLLVDKSPTYALDLEALERAERLFESPKYIHLVRHPYAVINSFLRARLDKLMGPSLFAEPVDDPYIVAEAIWTESNRTTLKFLEGIEPNRQQLVLYEDLVSDPVNVMTRVCQFLKIPFNDAVLNPYDNPSERMMGGIGDPNIFRHDRINPERSNVWEKIKLPRYLDETTKRLAYQFGYELPGDTSTSGLSSVQLGDDLMSLDLDELSNEQIDRLLNELQKEES